MLGLHRVVAWNCGAEAPLFSAESRCKKTAKADEQLKSLPETTVEMKNPLLKLYRIGKKTLQGSRNGRGK